MKKWNSFFWLCLTGMIILTAGVIFLPRYISRSLDQRSLNWVEVAERDNFSFLEPSDNGVLENERAFRNLTFNGDNLTLITSIEEYSQMNSILLENIYEQAMIAADCGMLPWIGWRGYEFAVNVLGTGDMPYSYWADQAKFAKYYSLTYESEENPNKTEMLNFWYVRFSDNQTFDYYFIVNAVSYQIYYVRMHNLYTDFLYKIETGSYNVELVEAYGEIMDGYRIKYGYINLQEMVSVFSLGCSEYYTTDTYEYVSSENLYDKLGVTILYYGSNSVYIEYTIAKESAFLDFQGVEIGFQELANKVQFLD